uniref:Enoyl reductase (ER) domain-containing protein n=1 Tax=Oryza glumipatula TaxID=40148 RepID=A0A0E0BQJ9_9ORYZ
MALVAVSNKRVILKRYLTACEIGQLGDEMEVVTAEAVPLSVPAGSSAMLMKNLYISCDLYLRNRMIRHEVPTYISDFVPGEVVTSHGVMKVISSGHLDFKAGDLVSGMTGWEEYTLINNPESLFKINYPEFPLSNYTGVLGMHGLTAYVGFFEMSKPKKGEYVFVSSACGAIGQIIGQLAKIKGCYVVNLLKTKFGFDDAFNYKKEPDLEAALKRLAATHLRCFPEGMDIDFENVGGAMLDTVLPNMRLGGRITMCGMISQYHLERPEGVRNLMYIITKQLRMEGFVIFDSITVYRQFEEEMAGY